MPRYARMIYNGYWFSPERKLLQGLIDASQAHVNGTVRVEAVQGQRHGASAASRRPIRCSTRASPHSRTTPAPTTRRTPAGFIRLNALRMRIAARRGRA